MDKPTFDKLTKFAQNIVDSTPREGLEDEWVEYEAGDDIFDVNIWFEDGPVRATAYPTRILPNGYRETIGTIYCNIPIKERDHV